MQPEDWDWRLVSGKLFHCTCIMYIRPAPSELLQVICSSWKLVPWSAVAGKMHYTVPLIAKNAEVPVVPRRWGDTRLPRRNYPDNFIMMWVEHRFLSINLKYVSTPSPSSYIYITTYDFIFGSILNKRVVFYQWLVFIRVCLAEIVVFIRIMTMFGFLW